MGFIEDDIKHLSSIMSEVIKNDNLSEHKQYALRKEVIEFRQRFYTIVYGLRSLEDALNRARSAQSKFRLGDLNQLARAN